MMIKQLSVHFSGVLNFKKIGTFFLFLILQFAFAQSTINLYVDASRTNTLGSNGQSWASAFPRLEDALNVSNNDNSLSTYAIHVAKGTYNTPVYVNSGGQNYILFAITRGNVSIYGGYPSGGGSERSPTINLTTLNGVNNNSHILVIAGVGNNPVLIDGFTITGGRGSNWMPDVIINGMTIDQKSGVGVKIKESPSNPNLAGVKFDNMRFRDNITPTSGNPGYYGGAMHVDNAKLEIDNSIFANNSSAYGGALYVTNSTSFKLDLNVSNTTFTNNSTLGTSATGGSSAMYMKNSITTFDNVSLFNNTSTNSSSVSGTIDQIGGVFRVFNSTFTGNGSSDSSGSNGGGGGAIKVNPNNDPDTFLEIENSYFENNRSRIGGAILMDGTNASRGNYIIKNSKFINNRSYVEAGAIRLNFFGGSMFNSEFRGNVSGGAAGAVCFNSPTDNLVVNSLFTGNYLQYEWATNEGQPSGFAIHKHQNGSLTIVNSTFSGNSGTLPNWYTRPKGTIALSGGNNYIYNSIIYDNLWGDRFSIHNMDVTGDYTHHDTSTYIYVYNSIVQSGRTPNSFSANYPYHINGNDDFTSGNSFSANPLFVAPVAWQTSSSSTNIYNFSDGDYTLQPISPAINRGNTDYYSSTYPNVELLDLLRIHNGNIDMGPYEYGSVPPGTNTVCVKHGVEGIPFPTSMGISTYDVDNNNKFRNSPNGLLVLDSKEKGFVITRVRKTSDIPSESSIQNPIKGMIVYDLSDNCIKLYNGTKWNCIEKSCNE